MDEEIASTRDENACNDRDSEHDRILTISSSWTVVVANDEEIFSENKR